MKIIPIQLAMLAAVVWLASGAGLAQQFEEVAAARGLEWKGVSYTAYGMLAVWVDYNGDGWDDLFFTPHSLSFGKTPLLWRNNKGRFELCPIKEVFPELPASDTHMGSWGDFNNDGLPDYFQNSGGAAGSGTPHKRHLLENRAGVLRQVAGQYPGLSPMLGSGRSALWFDFNNDRRLDLVAVNQTVKKNVHTFSELFRNDGHSFTNVSAATGFLPTAGANFAVASDVLNRGRAQIVLLGAEDKAHDETERGLIAEVFEVADGKCRRLANPPQDKWGRDAAVFDFDGASSFPSCYSWR